MKSKVMEPKTTTRSPNWTRDELILALDLYFRVNPAKINKSHPAVQELSQILNALPNHSSAERAATFRNASGVYMKLCNFLSLDPSYLGKGLGSYSALDEKVWRDFNHRRDYLTGLAAVLRSTAVIGNHELASFNQDDVFEAAEGLLVLRLHYSRERNRALVARKKQIVKKAKGCLACEVCGFDFFAFYGPMGEGFIECHHTIPVSSLTTGCVTKVKDLALVCSNCHRMLHRRGLDFSIGDLRQLLASNRV